MSDLITTKIQEWRQKSLAGTMTIDDCREAIAAIRKERVAASEKSTKSRAAKAAKPQIDSDDLLSELGL